MPCKFALTGVPTEAGRARSSRYTELRTQMTQFKILSIRPRAPMAITFHAHVLDISEEDSVTRVILSVDDTLEAERYLMTQRKHAFSGEDVRFGMNDVYIETCGQGWSWYGHIDAFDLFDNRVRVQLDAEAAHRIGDDGVIEVSFDLTGDERAALRAALRTTFAGQKCYADWVV